MPCEIPQRASNALDTPARLAMAPAAESEADPIERAKAGDAEAFGALRETYRPGRGRVGPEGVVTVTQYLLSL